jgi:hypothetical protein
MDDDFSFSSIWGAPSDPLPLPSPLKETIIPPTFDFPASSSSSQDDDDFDDFGTARTGPSDAQDDDFGDFGDAQEMTTPADFENVGFDQARIAEPTIPESDWEPLRLDPMPSRADLRARLDELLGPIWADDISEFTTAEDIRQVEGVSQILITPERYSPSEVYLNSNVHIYFRSAAISTIRYFILLHLRNRQTGRAHEFASNTSSPSEYPSILMRYCHTRTENHSLHCR